MCVFVFCVLIDLKLKLILNVSPGCTNHCTWPVANSRNSTTLAWRWTFVGTVTVQPDSTTLAWRCTFDEYIEYIEVSKMLLQRTPGVGFYLKELRNFFLSFQTVLN